MTPGGPSREFDAFIAERILELRVDRTVWTVFPCPTFKVSSSDGARADKPLPQYSTDRAAAMQVVEKLKERGLPVKVAPEASAYEICCAALKARRVPLPGEGG